MQASQVKALISQMMSVSEGISDLNFTVGRLPQVEIYGELKAVKVGGLDSPLTPAHTEALARGLIDGNENLIQALNEHGSVDSAYDLDDGRRFRVAIFKAKGNHSIVLRSLPSEIPDFDELGLPEILKEVAELRNGLMLVTGGTGSGKSTTLAAIIDRINQTRAVHIVTLEDPVEFAHSHKKATINQRELAQDFGTFADGLKAALRQAPKVILVGEMRDQETIEIALKAAETGHLVLSTLHTIDAGQTINRMVGVFDVAEQKQVRSRLAQTLRFVVCQRLLPRVEGGRVAALEIMGNSLRSRELMLNDEDADKTFYQVIAEARAYGWQTFDQHIVDLFEHNQITEEAAKAYCSDISTVSRALDAIRAERGEETSDIGELQMDRLRQLENNRR